MAEGPSRSFMLNALNADSSYQPGNNHLLLIGIDAYQQVARLSNAVRDVQAFKDLLHSRYTFEAQRTYELYDERATRKGIMGQLRKLTQTVQRNDNLVVYFSGHGHFDELIKEGYWVPVDAEYDDIDDYITYSFITKVIKAIPAQHTVFIVDSCYSGAVLMGDRDLGSERFERDPSRWMIASGRNEVVPDGIAGKHSPFADKLIDILDRYATEGLRMGSLVDKLITAVTYNSRQTPIGRPLYEVGDQGGEFFFRPKRNQAADYQTAMNAGSSQSWERFLEIYPNSTHKAEIETRITDLQEQEAWTEAQKRNTITAFRSYRQQFPDGAHRSDALDNMEQLEADRDWPKVQRRNTISGYKRFLESHPRCQQRPEAEAAIEGLLAAQQKSANKRSKPLAAAAGLPPRQTTVPQRRYALDWRIPAGVVTLALLIALGIWAAKDEEAEKESEQDHARAAVVEPTPEDSVAESQPHDSVITVDPFDITMVLINGGTFTMGDIELNNKNLHQATVSDFYIGQYEITQAQWRDVMDTNPSHYPDCDQCPVETVSWKDIEQFIDKLNTQTGQTYRLPTEAEWEYAAGGGASDRTRFAGTNHSDHRLEWYTWCAENDKGKPQPVGKKLPNGLGLYDMSGNVWEWCHDWFAMSLPNTPSQNPTGPLSGEGRVLRGGDWKGTPRRLSVAGRAYNPPVTKNKGIGFRLARTP